MPATTETAILIHGLWMHGVVFLPHQRWLEKQGFGVRRFSYPSWRLGLEENAAALTRFVAETPGATIHLVAHSLGGLIALIMLGRPRDKRVRRVVLMGTPYAGCHCGTYMVNMPPLSPLLGRSMKDWLNLPQPMPSESVDIGVIAGTHSWGLGRVIPGLPRPNDGVVSVAETRVPGAKDTIALPVSHSGMLLSRLCAAQVVSFLRTGSFIRA